MGTTVMGCEVKHNDKNNETPMWSYRAAEEEMINVTREGVEIASIEMINIPKKGIKVAGWDSTDIAMKVMYTDLTTDTFPFKEKHIPMEYRHFLGEVGHHTLSLAVNGVDLHFGFDIIENPDFHGYTCNFRNTRMQDDPIVQTITVGYYQTAVYTAGGFPDKDIDVDNVERFIGWDYPLTCVHQDMEYRNVFRNVEKRFYGRAISDDNHYRVIKTVQKDDTWNVLFYLGRSQSATFNHGKAIYHKQGNVEDELAFGQFNPYNEMWNELNETIYEYGVDYSINPKYNSMLYGTNGSFSNSTTFLADFESMYRNDQGEIPSLSVVLEDQSLVDTSNKANYATSYHVASTYLTYTKNVDQDAEPGYYRIGVTMAYDIYVSVAFKKLAEGKYSLLQGSKFNFAPVEQSKKVVLQFSENEEFDCPIEKKLSFSNETLYNIADSLAW